MQLGSGFHLLSPDVSHPFKMDILSEAESEITRLRQCCYGKNNLFDSRIQERNETSDAIFSIKSAS